MSEKGLLDRIRERIGVSAGKPTSARDPVNQPMIRHWCDAVGDRNPVYTDPEFAEKSVHGGIVAPPTMLQAWTMPGLLSKVDREARASIPGVFRLLDEAGFTSVIATNCTQEYRRYLRPGDLLSATQSLEDVSEEKQTALGAGHFVTQLTTYTDQHGEVVATMRFRLLKFRPPERDARSAASARPALQRPRPGITHDNRFFWEGVEARKLLIQRCRCGKLRHPPGPMCPACHSVEWDTVEASGRGTVYSYVVAHHPPIPPFEYPNPIVLVELEEGIRLVSNLVGVERDEIEIGMSVRARFEDLGGNHTLLQFEPVEDESR